MKRILITTTAIAALGLAFIAGTNGETLTTRIDNAIHDLEKVHAPIPHEALHAKALEILRGRTVAKDDEPKSGNIEDRRVLDLSLTSGLPADVSPCVAFTKTSMEKVACK